MRSVRVITRRVVNGAKVDTTEGDEILNADDLRSKYGVTGAGIKIGVISNGVDHLGDAVASADPVDLIKDGFKKLDNVLCRDLVRQFRESYDVHEHHGGNVILIGDAFPADHSVGNVLW